MKFFKKQGNKLTAIKSAYDKAEVNIDKICSVLERHQMQLLKDIHTMDELYHLNEEYYKELTMYILAGKISLEEAKNNIYPQMKAEAEHTRDAQDAQKVNDYASFIGYLYGKARWCLHLVLSIRSRQWRHSAVLRI